MSPPCSLDAEVSETLEALWAESEFAMRTDLERRAGLGVTLGEHGGLMSGARC